MDIREVISKATKSALKYYGDKATEEFFSFLEKREFKTKKCLDCGHVDFPPRNFCSKCFSENTEWIDIPKRGKVYAITSQKRALRFMYPDKIGYVEIPGVGYILTKIEGDADIGDEVQLDFVETDGITLHVFRKV